MASGPSRRTLLQRVGQLGVIGALSGCLQGGGGNPTTQSNGQGTTVAMVNTSFSPLTRSVPTGTTVTWTNQDSSPHTVVAAHFHTEAQQWEFDSENVQAGQSVTYTFDSEGIYEYYCDIHGQSSMCGAILVGGATLSKDLPCEDGGMY